MPRPKGSKNKTKTAEKTTVISTIDYTELIEEKLNEKTQISAEITSITDQLEALKAQLKDKKKTLNSIEKELTKLETRKTEEEAKAAEEAKKIQLESMLQQLLNSGMSTDEILDKLK